MVVKLANHSIHKLIIPYSLSDTGPHPIYLPSVLAMPLPLPNTKSVFPNLCEGS